MIVILSKTSYGDYDSSLAEFIDGSLVLKIPNRPDFIVKPNQMVAIDTGIYCELEDDEYCNLSMLDNRLSFVPQKEIFKIPEELAVGMELETFNNIVNLKNIVIYFTNNSGVDITFKAGTPVCEINYYKRTTLKNVGRVDKRNKVELLK